MFNGHMFMIEAEKSDDVISAIYADSNMNTYEDLEEYLMGNDIAFVNTGRAIQGQIVAI
jgi:hypothetical protein